MTSTDSFHADNSSPQKRERSSSSVSDDNYCSVVPRAKKRARHLCSLGTGEVIHVLSYKAKVGMVDDFEFVIQVSAPPGRRRRENSTVRGL